MSRNRSKIDSEQRSKRSLRAAKGKIAVVKVRCPSCAHRKAFVKNEGTFCTRCRYKVE